MATTRERKEARAARLKGWAAKRAAKAEAGFERAHNLAQMIPMGQPILVGHHSEKRHRRHLAKIDAAGFGALADSRKADKMSSRAGGIEDQLARSIYDDDPDAIEALQTRIELLEERRAVIVDFNKAMRRKDADRPAIIAALPDAWRERYAQAARSSWADTAKGFPPYLLTNLGADIRRNKQRLDRLQTQQAPDFEERPRYLYSLRYEGECRKCRRTLERGAEALYFKLAKEIACYPECAS